MNANEKTCRKCGRDKHETAFPRNKRNADGRDRMCKACWSEYKENLRFRKTQDEQRAYERRAWREAGQQREAPKPPKQTAPQNGTSFWLMFSSTPKAERRALWIKLSKENHPDAGGTHEAMIEINEAYRLLK